MEEKDGGTKGEPKEKKLMMVTEAGAAERHRFGKWKPEAKSNLTESSLLLRSL